MSIPRLEPALNAPAAIKPPHPVSDYDFKRIVAILRFDDARPALRLVRIQQAARRATRRCTRRAAAGGSAWRC